MKKQIGSATLEIVHGDLTTLAVDAIVNAANTHLQHGGGVALAIARQGGPVIQQESDALIARRGGPLATGEAVITRAGNLPARYVIHTAGPVWGRQNEAESDRLLAASIGNSLALADGHALTSIAFPAISTGIYHFPLDRAATIMLQTTAEYLRGSTRLERVIFCLFDEASYRVFEAQLAG